MNQTTFCILCTSISVIMILANIWVSDKKIDKLEEEIEKLKVAVNEKKSV